LGWTAIPHGKAGVLMGDGGSKELLGMVEDGRDGGVM